MSSYEPLPDSTIEDDGDHYRSTISPYTEVVGIGSTQEELEMGVSQVEDIEDGPQKSREKYSSDKKILDEPPIMNKLNSDLKIPRQVSKDPWLNRNYVRW
jgi:hypothetical protein